MHQSKMKTPEIILTEDQRKEFTQIPANLLRVHDKLH